MASEISIPSHHIPARRLPCQAIFTEIDEAVLTETLAAHEFNLESAALALTASLESAPPSPHSLQEMHAEYADDAAAAAALQEAFDREDQLDRETNERDPNTREANGSDSPPQSGWASLVNSLWGGASAPDSTSPQATGSSSLPSEERPPALSNPALDRLKTGHAKEPQPSGVEGYSPNFPYLWRDKPPPLGASGLSPGSSLGSSQAGDSSPGGGNSTSSSRSEGEVPKAAKADAAPAADHPPPPSGPPGLFSLFTKSEAGGAPGDYPIHAPEEWPPCDEPEIDCISSDQWSAPLESHSHMTASCTLSYASGSSASSASPPSSSPSSTSPPLPAATTRYAASLSTASALVHPSSSSHPSSAHSSSATHVDDGAGAEHTHAPAERYSSRLDRARAANQVAGRARAFSLPSSTSPAAPPTSIAATRRTSLPIGATLERAPATKPRAAAPAAPAPRPTHAPREIDEFGGFIDGGHNSHTNFPPGTFTQGTFTPGGYAPGSYAPGSLTAGAVFTPVAFTVPNESGGGYKAGNRNPLMDSSSDSSEAPSRDPSPIPRESSCDSSCDSSSAQCSVRGLSTTSGSSASAKALASSPDEDLGGFSELQGISYGNGDVDGEGGADHHPSHLHTLSQPAAAPPAGSASLDAVTMMWSYEQSPKKPLRVDPSLYRVFT